MPDLLRADPERGNLICAGAIALAVTVVVLNVRFDEEWGAGIHLVYSAAAAALVAMLAFSPLRGSGRPAGWHSILFVATFVLAGVALGSLADVFGSEGGSGTLVWVGLLLTALMFRFATAYDSGISTLIGAVTVVVVVLAFVDWVFDPDGLGTFRWILLFTAAGLAAYGQMGGPDQRHHRVGFVNAAGVALLAIALTYAIEGFSLFFDAGGELEAATGWELVLLLGGAALIAYAYTYAQSGPGYLGVANLVAFVAVAGGASDDGPSLVGWPLLLVGLTAGLLVVALRPRT